MDSLSSNIRATPCLSGPQIRNGQKGQVAKWTRDSVQTPRRSGKAAGESEWSLCPGQELGKCWGNGNREDTVTEPYRRWQWVPVWQTSVDGANRTPGGWRDPCASVLDTQEPQRRLEPGWKTSRPSAGASAGGIEDSSKLESFLRRKQEAEEAESLVSDWDLNHTNTSKGLLNPGTLWL